MTENIDNYFADGKGFRCNPFQKGYLTDEERKKPFRWYGENFVFFSKTVDLSAGLEIYRDKDKKYPDIYYKTWEGAFLHDLIYFGMWWRTNILDHLNGFNGWDCVDIELDKNLGFQLNIKDLKL